MKAPIADHSGRCLHGAGTSFGGCSCKAYKARGKGKGQPCTCTHAEVQHAPRFELAAALERVARAFDETRDAVVAALAIRAAAAGDLDAGAFDVNPSVLLKETPPKAHRGPVPAGKLGVPVEGGGVLLFDVPRVTPAVNAAVNGHAAKPLNRSLSKCERALLVVLVQRDPKPTTAAQLGILAGYSASSSTFANSLGRLRTLGYARGPRKTIHVTGQGVSAAGNVPPLPRGRELLAHVRAQLAGCPARMLDVFADHVGSDVPKERLAELADYSPDSSTFANGVGRLRTLELVEGWHLHPDFRAQLEASS